MADSFDPVRTVGVRRTSWKRAHPFAYSQVERFASLLKSLVLVVGSAVAVLLILFLTRDLGSTPFQPEPSPPSTGGHAGITAQGFGSEELAPDEPSPWKEPETEFLIRTIADQGSWLAELPNTLPSNLGTGSSNVRESEGQGGRLGSGFGIGNGVGNGVGDGTGINRWLLKFKVKNSQHYAKLLDSNRIELAAIGGGISTIDYAYDLSAGIQRREGVRASENRSFYMIDERSPLANYEKEFLKKAGVIIKDRFILKFIPTELESKLATLEREYYLQHRSTKFEPHDISLTVFECVDSENGASWKVQSQQFLGYRSETH